MYIDESGNEGSPSNVTGGGSRYFTLGGIIVKEVDKPLYKSELNRIISDCFKDINLQDNFRLHYFDLREGRSPYDQLRKEDRLEIANGIFNVIKTNKSFPNDLGLIERARFGVLPLGLAVRYGISRLIDSRNCYELIQRGFVIPCSHNSHERIRTLDEIIAGDKGGMIFSPKIGLHENVVVLDYENEYTNLILKHDLSY
ncbi:MAG: DUF3800 domain-containing protein [Candidatus Nitrosopolaris sp.]